MISSVRIGIFLLLISIVAASCSSSKKAAEDMNMKEMIDDQKVLDALTRHPFHYTFLSARAKVRVKSPSLQISGNLQLRVAPGEAIWASVTKFGFEAFRMHMTKDTVRVIDRLNRAYVEEPVEKWMSMYQLPFGLRDVETILLGKGLVPDDSSYKIDSDEVEAHVSVQFREYAIQYLLQNMIRPQLVQMAIKDARGQAIKLTLSSFDFLRPGAGEFPFHRIIEAVSGDLPFDRLEITFNEVTLDEEKSMPFEIPRRYERMEP